MSIIVVFVLIVAFAFSFSACNNDQDIEPPNALANPDAMAEFLRNNGWDEVINSSGYNLLWGFSTPWGVVNSENATAVVRAIKVSHDIIPVYPYALPGEIFSRHRVWYFYLHNNALAIEWLEYIRPRFESDANELFNEHFHYKVVSSLTRVDNIVIAFVYERYIWGRYFGSY